MNPRLVPLLKTILYPALVVAAHQLVTNLPVVVALLPPKYQALLGPTVILVGGGILHRLESPQNAK